jgi:hypothetical protein
VHYDSENTYPEKQERGQEYSGPSGSECAHDGRTKVSKQAANEGKQRADS